MRRERGHEERKEAMRRGRRPLGEEGGHEESEEAMRRGRRP